MRQLFTFVAALFFAISGWAQPKRIVSTFPSATETLFALGVGEWVIGVSTYCRYPPVVLSLPRIGTYIKPDVEKMATLRPDLVIVQRTAGGFVERLAALGIRSTQVTFGSLSEVYLSTRNEEHDQ